MSSPFYPGFIEDLSPEDLRNLSEIDAAVSQNDSTGAPPQLPHPAEFQAEDSRSSQQVGFKGRTPVVGSEANDYHLTTQAASTSIQSVSNGAMQPSSSVGTALGFTSLRTLVGNLNGDYRSPSPEGPPPGQDYESWFNTSSTGVPAVAGFQSASTANGACFISAGKGTSFLPSEAAIQSAKKRMRDWEADLEEEFSYMQVPASQPEVSSPRRPVTPPRPSLDSDKKKTSPTPTSPRPVSPQSTSFTRPAGKKPFKPPLLSNKANLTNTTLTSLSNATLSKGTAPPLKQPLPPSTSASTLPKISTPSKATSDSALRTPVRLGGTRRPGSVKKFTTPFKPGMRPGEPGRAKLQEDQATKRSQEHQTDQVFQIQINSPSRKPVYHIPPSLKSPSSGRKGKEKAKEYRFFDLSQFDVGSLTSYCDI